jgi:hypothetical protein
LVVYGAKRGASGPLNSAMVPAQEERSAMASKARNVRKRNGGVEKKALSIRGMYHEVRGIVAPCSAGRD